MFYEDQIGSVHLQILPTRGHLQNTNPNAEIIEHLIDVDWQKMHKRQFWQVN